jgi:hypothetical protein
MDPHGRAAVLDHLWRGDWLALELVRLVGVGGGDIGAAVEQDVPLVVPFGTRDGPRRQRFAHARPVAGLLGLGERIARLRTATAFVGVVRHGRVHRQFEQDQVVAAGPSVPLPAPRRTPGDELLKQ